MKIQITNPSELSNRIVAIDLALECLAHPCGFVQRTDLELRSAIKTLKMIKADLLQAERNAAEEQRKGRATRLCKVCDHSEDVHSRFNFTHDFTPG